MKDRPALHMVERARQRDELKPGGMIIESTSGSLGLGLALAGARYGHPVTLVTDAVLEPMMNRMLRAHGARIDPVVEPHATGGWQQARRSRVGELLAANPGSFWPDQYNNPDNVAGYAPLALELVSQLRRIDVLVCSVGTGGHSAGVSSVLRHFFPDLRLVGVDTIGSVLFGQPARNRLMQGMGSSIHPKNIDYPAFDEIHWIGPREAVWSARQLAATTFASGGWSVGAVALVAGWIARHEDPDTRVAAIFPDGPYRYFDTVYNDDYCAHHDLLWTEVPDEPEVIAHPKDKEVTVWTRCAHVSNPVDSGEESAGRQEKR
jgi:S-sulfo-L-cysteine synthase (3-phospho-L-serine-dependent)